MYKGLIGKTLNTDDKKYFQDWIVDNVDPSEIEDILKLKIFKKRPDLLSAAAFYRSPQEIEKIVGLKIFKKNPNLLTPNAFCRKPDDIEEIINLDFFKTHPDLLTPSVFSKTAKSIMDMVSLDFFNEHPNLLTPCIFNQSTEGIVCSYLLYEYYYLIDYITSKHLVLRKEEVYSKIMYLTDTCNPILVETTQGKLKLSSIFFMTNKNMISNYGFSKTDLKERYDYNISEVKPIIEEKKNALIKRKEV